jgi:serine/threonine protein kinase
MGTLLSTSSETKSRLSTDEHSNYLIAGPPLGTGAFGTVFKAIRKSDDKEVAIKQIKKKRDNHSAMEREIAIMKKIATLKNEHLLELYAVFDDPIHCSLVMELARGGELFNRVAAKKKYTERDARVALQQILSGIQALHSVGILHRDLKPENCLYVEEGGDLLKIGDFGLGIDLDNEDGSLEYVDRKQVGSLNYCAPEVISRMNYSAATDIWAVGVMMYVLLVGNYPYNQYRDHRAHEHDQRHRELLRRDVGQGDILERTEAWKKVSGLLV